MFAVKFLRLPNVPAHIRFLSELNNYTQFSSKQSLDKLYSNKPTKIDNVQTQSFEGDNFTGYIPVKNLDISYCTSSGPGGQNVNRVNTKVTVKFHLASADWIPDNVKTRITELHKNSINKEGYWMIRSDKTRNQTLNLSDCMDKLRCYIVEAVKPIHIEPTFETLELIKKRRERAAIKRLETKKHRSMYKSQKNLDF